MAFGIRGTPTACHVLWPSDSATESLKKSQGYEDDEGVVMKTTKTSEDAVFITKTTKTSTMIHLMLTPLLQLWKPLMLTTLPQPRKTWKWVVLRVQDLEEHLSAKREKEREKEVEMEREGETERVSISLRCASVILSIILTTATPPVRRLHNILLGAH
jgi:hypothetical protein